MTYADYLDEVPMEKRLANLLRQARQYVSDAGTDEDAETQRLSADLLASIDDALGAVGPIERLKSPMWLTDRENAELYERQPDGSYKAAYRMVPIDEH